MYMDILLCEDFCMDLMLNESYLCFDVKTFVWTYFYMDNIYCVMCDFPV
jgi:hypothetical protein